MRMSGPYSDFNGDQQRDDDDISSYGPGALHSGDAFPGHAFAPERVVENPAARRSIAAISKNVILSIQTAFQVNSRSRQMMPENAPASAYIQPQTVQKIANEGGRIAKTIQQSAIIDGVGNRLSSVNDRLANVNLSALRRSAGTFSMTKNSDDRGIYSSQSMRSWGNAVSVEISSFTVQKVATLFRRSSSCPTPGGGGFGNHSKIHNENEVSFDYRLMEDNE